MTRDLSKRRLAKTKVMTNGAGNTDQWRGNPVTFGKTTQMENPYDEKVRILLRQEYADGESV
jgi:hypothetical protein